MSLAHLRSAETSLLQIAALLPADNNLPGSSPERWGMTYPWEEGLNPHVPTVETQQSHPVVTELISVGLFRSAGASRTEGSRSRAHPAGKGPPCHGNSASSRQMDWAKHSSQMAPDFLPWVPVLLIEKGRCLAENWMIFRSFFWRWFLLITFPSDSKASWISWISHWGQVTKIFVRDYLGVKHHIHCSILCPAQWILPGSAQPLMDPKQSTLPDRP